MEVQAKESGQLNQNLEIKAKVAQPDRLREKASQIATAYLGVLHQVDTYYHCERGRLKLRSIREGDPTGAATHQLIFYQREDKCETKASHYRIAPVNDGEAMHKTLAAAYGVRSVVTKQREVFLCDNVRIHLDAVEGLGAFVELEAVQDGSRNAQSQSQLVADLCSRLQIDAGDLLAESYGELVGPAPGE